MNKVLWISIALLMGLLPLSVSADDFTPPTVTFNAPGEGTCWQINAAHPELGLVVSAEDPSGVKQGILWMSAGHRTRLSAPDEWTRVWGHTFVRDGSAPESVRQTIMIRMLGRPEGEYSFMVEFADMAHHNTNFKILHTSIDFSPPTVAITSPANGSIVCSDRDLRINVTAGDTGCGVGQVQLYLGAVTSTTPVAVDTSAPYELVIPKSHLGVDPLRVIVRAIDKAGRSSQAEITVRPIRICLMHRPIKR